MSDGYNYHREQYISDKLSEAVRSCKQFHEKFLSKIFKGLSYTEKVSLSLSLWYYNGEAFLKLDEDLCNFTTETYPYYHIDYIKIEESYFNSKFNSYDIDFKETYDLLKHYLDDYYDFEIESDYIVLQIKNFGAEYDNNELDHLCSYCGGTGHIHGDHCPECYGYIYIDDNFSKGFISFDEDEDLNENYDFEIDLEEEYISQESTDERINESIVNANTIYNNEIEQQGREGEKALNNWFKKYNLPYVYLNQDKTTFASLFSGSIKRPDFLLLFDSLGLIAVDVKHLSRKEFQGNYFFNLTYEGEVQKAIAFERIFRIPVWYAIKENNSNNEEWFWISCLKAFEVGAIRNNREKGFGSFVAINVNEFKKIEVGEDLAKLYLERMPCYKRISNL